MPASRPPETRSRSTRPVLACARSAHGARVRSRDARRRRHRARARAPRRARDVLLRGRAGRGGTADRSRARGARPDAVLHVGIAGSRTLEPPALVLGSEAVYCDVIDPASTLPRVERVAARRRAARAGARRSARGARPPDRDLRQGRRGNGLRRRGDGGLRRAPRLRARRRAGRRAARDLELAGRGDRARWRFDDAFAALADALHRLDVV